jgi:hypothetical protein
MYENNIKEIKITFLLEAVVVSVSIKKLSIDSLGVFQSLKENDAYSVSPGKTRRVLIKGTAKPIFC